MLPPKERTVLAELVTHPNQNYMELRESLADDPASFHLSESLVGLRDKGYIVNKNNDWTYTTRGERELRGD